MEIKLLNQKENKLLKRDEFQAEISGTGPTTSRKVVLAEAAKALGVAEELIIVDKITTKRGSQDSWADLLVYKKKEDIPKTKIEKMEKRIFGVAKKAEAAPPAQEKAAK